MMKRMSLAAVTALAILAGWGGSAPAAALSFAWDGTVVVVDTNMAGSIHGSVVAGVSTFSGFFVWPDTCGIDCIVEPFGPDETNYVFPNGSGYLVGGGGTSIGIESSVNIVNDQIIDQDGVDVGATLGLTLTLGQTIDVWSVASENDAEFTSDFVDWSVEYVYSTSDPLSNTAFVASAPPNPDLILFTINQDDGDVYLVVGVVDTVPEPGLGLMLGSGLLGLAGAGRARRDPHRTRR